MIIEEKKYQCDCSKERYLRGILSLGKEKLTNILKESEIVCNFCKEKYIYTKDEIEKLIKNQ